MMNWIGRGLEADGSKERDVAIIDDSQIFCLSQKPFAEMRKFGTRPDLGRKI